MHDHEEQLSSLLDSWEEARARGESPTPQDLCRDTPHLLPELARRIAVLSRFESLHSDGSGTSRDTEAFASQTAASSCPTPTSAMIAPSRESPLPGHEYGCYRLEELLGTGG